MIKVGFCVAYDWEYLKRSVPRVYEHADKICFSIDKNRKGWSGKLYDFDEKKFNSWLAVIDVKKKIDLYEDDFALPELSAMQNDNRQRMLMANRMGTGGWHVQVDSDEYFLDFGEFVNKLKSIHNNPSGWQKPLNVCGLYVPLIKKTENGYLYVDFKKKLPEYSPFATNRPEYSFARKNGHFNVIVPTYVIHETWARSEENLMVKINSWGHSSEEFSSDKRKLSYMNLWKSLDEFNYPYLANFHPDINQAWPSLAFCKGNSIEEFLQNFPEPKFPLSPLALWLRNNRNFGRLKMLLNKIHF
jgi:hypothetical protein